MNGSKGSVCFAFIGILSLFSLAMAGPVVTVPWSGHPGAVSFTFDDGCQSQITNAVPALKARNIHATFFLYDVGGTFSNNKAAWIDVAKAGNEIANHSLNHANFSQTIDAKNEVSGMATLLRNADPSIQAVTFAYPGCAVGYRSEIDAENIIGRSCMFAAPFLPLQWNSPPSDWTNVGAIYIGDDATATGPTITAIDAAKNGGWITTLVHGVGGDWGTIATNNVIALFDRAIQDGLWVGTYQEVAAYWRAGLTMDTVKAISQNTGWALSWKSPHARMPISVSLRVRLDAATFGNSFEVYQKGNRIMSQSDGSYLIEFMNLSLDIRKPTSSSSSSQSSSSSVVRSPFSSMAIPGLVQMENYDIGGEGVSYHDVDSVNSGNIFRHDGVDIDSLGNGNYTLGWTVAGEWTEYTTNFVSSGIQNFTARVATGMDSCSFHLDLDGVNVSGSKVVPNTGGWSSYQDVSGVLTSVSSGKHVLRFNVDRSYCNIDWIKFESPTTVVTSPIQKSADVAAYYRIYDMKGQLRDYSKEESMVLEPGAWLVIGLDAQGRWISSRRITVSKP